MITYLLIPGYALWAAPAATNKRHSHPITKTESPDIPANCCNSPCQLVTWNMRKSNIRVVTFPTVPVAATHASRSYFDDYAVPFWLRNWDVPYLGPSSELFV